MPGKVVKPYETPGDQEGKQGGQENLVVLVVCFPVKDPSWGLKVISIPFF